METDVEVRTCAATKVDGSRCTVHTVRGSEFCWAHSPELEDKRAEAKSLGGRKRQYVKGIPVDVSSSARILAELGEVCGNLKELDCSPQAMNSLISALKAAADVIEGVELEARLAALEAALEARK